MLWIMREHPKIDRIAGRRLILRLHGSRAHELYPSREVPLSRPLPLRPRRHPRRGFTCRKRSIVRFVDPSK